MLLTEVFDFLDRNGDSPARQLEERQQCRGMFLCICGVQDGNFGNQNKGGSFHNLDARLQNFNKTKTWSSGFDNGNIAVSKLSEYVIYATNKLTEELEAELLRRNVAFSNSHQPAQLEKLLNVNLKGIKGPPALLCSRLENQADISQYEIALMEPLHDFKNVINRVLKNLPRSTEEKELKVMLTKLLSDIEAQNREMKGIESRMNVVKVAVMLKKLNLLLMAGQCIGCSFR
ncbi:hypothetical protein EB796_004717 [Bugula neritina]|uniref:Uncharacterized protein n=1 Tax=Bugula neritina TaxID=10212 RepID=A0A7J7KFI1_BUGNE|nr:hypothetical protein EB796_004717 [Bugula neritina]